MNGSPNPISPANAGAQIRAEQSGMTRPAASFRSAEPVGSIWIPAFAGKIESEKGERSA